MQFIKIFIKFQLLRMPFKFFIIRRLLTDENCLTYITSNLTFFYFNVTF